MAIPFADQQRLRVFGDGDLSSNIFSFSEPVGASSSSLLDFSTRVAWSGRISKSAGTNRSGTAAVAHRPWEDGVPCGPRWNYGQYCDAMAPELTRIPKTFKPVLLYHRPEDSNLKQPARFRSCNDGHDRLSICGAENRTCCYLQNCLENRTDLFSSAVNNAQFCKTGVNGFGSNGFPRNCSCNCSSGFLNSLNLRTNHFALKPIDLETCHLNRPGQTIEILDRHCCGSCSWTDCTCDSYSVTPQNPFPVTSQTSQAANRHPTFPANPQNSFLVNPQTPFSMGSFSVSSLAVNPTQTSFPVIPQTPFSVTPHTPKSYLPLFARHPMTLENGSASEIRRALLLNHPVFNDICMECNGDSCEKLDLQHNPRNNRVDGTHSCGDKSGGVFQTSSDKLGACSHINKGINHQNLKDLASRASDVNSDLAHIHVQPPKLPVQAEAVTTHTAAAPSMSQWIPQTPFASTGVDGWQEWAGRYGSFMQLLNAPDYPVSSLDTKPLTASVMSDQTEKQLFDPTSSCLHTSLQGMSEHAVTGLYTAPQEGSSEADTDDREDRRHKCPYCDVACTNNGQLKGHLRVHTGERPYRCECGRAFARNEELTRHRRIHSGLRPHQCNTCGKRFGRKDHLNKHQKTHLRTSEKKIHMCQVPGCRQRYTRSDALARHQWGAHGIKAKTSRIRPSAKDDQMSVGVTAAPKSRYPETELL